MSLLDKYKEALTYDLKEKKLKSRVNQIENELQAFIITNGIYISYSEFMKYIVLYKDRDLDYKVICTYSEEGYSRIVNYKKLLREELGTLLYPVGAYDLVIDGELIKETSLDYLWKEWEKKNV